MSKVTSNEEVGGISSYSLCCACRLCALQTRSFLG
jgi:hypothetical protein